MFGDFGKSIKEIRISKGLTIRKAAKEIGINFSYLNDIERAKRNPPTKKIILSILQTYNITKKSDVLNLIKLATELEGENRVPCDIADFLVENPSVVDLIRKLKHREFIDKDYIDQVRLECKNNNFKDDFQRLYEIDSDL